MAGKECKLENWKHPESNVLQGTAKLFHDPWRLAACVCSVHVCLSNSVSCKNPLILNMLLSIYFIFHTVTNPHTRQQYKKSSICQMQLRSDVNHFIWRNVTPAKYSVCYRMTCANHCTEMATIVSIWFKKKMSFYSSSLPKSYHNPVKWVHVSLRPHAH